MPVENGWDEVLIHDYKSIKMKRLLTPLLAALALPTAVSNGSSKRFIYLFQFSKPYIAHQ